MREIRWTERAEDHIAAHGVSPDEVEQVVNTRPRLVLPGRGDTEYVFGTTEAGRYLLVVLAEALDGRDYVATTREMTGYRAPNLPAKREVTTMTKLDEIAEYAQAHDFAAEMEQGIWEEDTEPDPMVTTSVRLPKSLLDWVREQATNQHVRPSVLIRQWLEQHRDTDTSDEVEDLVTRVSRLVLQP